MYNLHPPGSLVLSQCGSLNWFTNQKREVYCSFGFSTSRAVHDIFFVCYFRKSKIFQVHCFVTCVIRSLFACLSVCLSVYVNCLQVTISNQSSWNFTTLVEFIKSKKHCFFVTSSTSAKVNNFVNFLKSLISIWLTSYLKRISRSGHWTQPSIIFEVNIDQKVNIGQRSTTLMPFIKSSIFIRLTCNLKRISTSSHWTQPGNCFWGQRRPNVLVHTSISWVTVVFSADFLKNKFSGGFINFFCPVFFAVIVLSPYLLCGWSSVLF